MDIDDLNILPTPADWNTTASMIKVIGVGGGGCNAVDEMFRRGIKNVDFIVCNTDRQSLEQCAVPKKLKLGNLGAGCNPEKGKQAALNASKSIESVLKDNCKMVFITAGMGGGTGTGASPIIAKIARELGLLTVAVVTLPFKIEGIEFMRRAVKGIKELKRYVDSLVIIDNQKLYKVFGKKSISEGFKDANSVLCTAVQSITDIITSSGKVNVDFADVTMVMKDAGMAIMGTGEAKGSERARIAVEEAFKSPLLNEINLSYSKGLLVNITTDHKNELALSEDEQILEFANNFTNHPPKFKRGIVYKEDLDGKIKVTIVATGFPLDSLPQIDLEDNGQKTLHDPEPGAQPVKTLQTDNDGSEITIDLTGSGNNFNRGTITAGIRNDENEDDQEKQIVVIDGKEYEDKEQIPEKPVLIISSPGEIPDLENIPAYKRRRALRRAIEKSKNKEIKIS
ncbi:MAG: cell division protein FtsZ [Bacteroidales bacterium]|jgi:cell division protein FtsZ|nr:cell division protein FtsZ [Bacteroidales bacterium]